MGYPDGQTKKLVQSLNKRRFQTAVPYALNGKCGNRGRFDMWGEGGSRRGWVRYWVNLGSIGAIGAVFWDTNAPPTRSLVDFQTPSPAPPLQPLCQSLF